MDSGVADVLSITGNGGAKTAPTDFAIEVGTAINYQFPETNQYVIYMSDVLGDIRDVDGGPDGQTIKITIKGLTDVDETLVGKTVYIPSVGNVGYTIDGNNAILELSVNDVIDWYNYWVGLSGDEQTEAATLVMARFLDGAWDDAGNAVEVEITNSEIDPLVYNPDRSMLPPIMPEDQVAIPVYDADEPSIPDMKDAAIQYSLERVFKQIYNVLIKNDGVNGLASGTEFQGDVDTDVLANILTQGIGGTEESSLDFLFFSSDGITQSKQQPKVLFFDDEYDVEQISGKFGPLLENRVSANTLIDLFQEWFTAAKANELGGLPPLDPTLYSIYIVPENQKDVDFRFTVNLNLKDLSENSEEVTTIIIDENVPVIVTKDLGTFG